MVVLQTLTNSGGGGVALIVSAGACVTAAGALIGFGSLKNKVDTHERILQSTPTRGEFDLICDGVNEIRQDVKELIRRTGTDRRGGH